MTIVSTFQKITTKKGLLPWNTINVKSQILILIVMIRAIDELTEVFALASYLQVTKSD